MTVTLVAAVEANRSRVHSTAIDPPLRACTGSLSAALLAGAAEITVIVKDGMPAQIGLSWEPMRRWTSTDQVTHPDRRRTPCPLLL